MGYMLQVTEANHADNQFYTLGGAGFDSEDERQENLYTIPEFTHDCDNDDRCYILDILGDDDFSLVGGREISAATARELLGVDDFEELRESERQRWNLVRKISEVI